MKRQYKQLVKLNGGIAIPLGNNYFYMKGRKHSTGGIDVDKNLEVEDGEIVHAGKKSTKVYSSLPFLNGISPVEKLLGGHNPNKVFAEQERFKDKHGINDDGTMKKKKAYVGMETKTKTDIPAGAKIGLELFTDAAQKEIQAKQDFNKRAEFLYNTRNDMDVNKRIAKAFEFAKKNARENANIISHGYIGGKTIEARKKFWDSDKDIRQFTDSVAKSHKLDPHVLRNSLSNEGIVDVNIRKRNIVYKDIINNDKNYVLDVTGKDFLNDSSSSNGFGLYGLDDSKTYYDGNESMRNLIDKSGIKAETGVNTNEKGRTVYTLKGKNNAENIIIHSATLKTIQDMIAQQKRYKGIPKDSLNDLTLYHFNYGPYAKTPFNVAKIRQGRYNAKNYKAMGGETKRRGLYSVTSNGQTKLYRYPSTGDETQNNRVVAEWGTHFKNALKNNRVTRFIANELGLDFDDNDIIYVRMKDDKGKDVKPLAISRKEYIAQGGNPDIVTYDPITRKYSADYYTQLAGRAPNFRIVGKIVKGAKQGVQMMAKNKVNVKQTASSYKQPTPTTPKDPKVISGIHSQYKFPGRTANPFKTNAAKPSHYPNQTTGRTAPNVGTNLMPINVSKTANVKEGVNMGLVAANLAARRGVNAVANAVKSGKNILATQSPVKAGIAMGTVPLVYYLNGVQFGNTSNNNEVNNNTPNFNANKKSNTSKNTTHSNVNNTNTDNIVKTDSVVNNASDSTKVNKPTKKLSLATRLALNQYAQDVIDYNKDIKLNTKDKRYNTTQNNQEVTNSKIDNVNNNIQPGATQYINNPTTNKQKTGNANNKSNKPINNTNKNNKLKTIKSKKDITFDARFNPLSTNAEDVIQDMYNKEHKIIALDNPTIDTSIAMKQLAKEKDKINSFTPVKTKIPFFKRLAVKNPYLLNDVISGTSNITGNIISSIFNKKAIDAQKYPNEPIGEQAAKLKTRVNINPQLNRNAENEYLASKDIQNNTSSSNVALGRKQQVGIRRKLSDDNLYAQQEYQQNQLINQDRLNQQEVANRNVIRYNEWLNNKALFDNNIANLRAENKVGAINNVNATIQDLITRREKRDMERRNIAAYSLANPNVSDEYLKKLRLYNIIS